MKINVHIVKGSELVNIGYIEAENFNADRCYDMCNWKKYKLKSKPENLFADIESHGHGLCFTNPNTNEMWLAKSIGWLVGTESEINDYIQENANESVWL